MSVNAGGLVGTLSANISSFVAGMREATRVARRTSRDIRREFDIINEAARNSRRGSDDLGASFKDIGRIVNGILIAQTFYQGVQAIKRATDEVASFAIEMERAQVSLTYMLGSLDKAEGFMAVMKDFAAVTDFSTKEVLEMSRRLIAMGFEAESAGSVMRVITDEVSLLGGGFDKVDRIVYALGQIKNSAKLASPEVRQLINATVPAGKYLQEAFNITGEQVKNIGDVGIAGEAAVAALLAGMEKDSKGMTEILANTFSGMVNTIKDDFLILSEDLVKPIFNLFKSFIAVIRDSLEELRKVMTESGLGGVLDAMFPPEIANNIRIIIGTIKVLMQAMYNLYRAVQPVMVALGTVLVSVLATIGPPIAAAVLYLAGLARGLIETVPLVKTLAVALTSLFVVVALGKAFMVFFSIMRIGVILSFVATAVRHLAVAIRILYVALSSHPIAAIITLIAAAFIYLAYQMGWLDKAIKNLTGTLQGLAGINPNEILQPVDKKIKESQEQFNKNWRDTIANLNGVGAAADDAGDDVKKKFLASFDEVFQIPEKLDDIADSFNLPDANDFNYDDFASAFDYELPDIFGDYKLDLSWLENLFLIPQKMDTATNSSIRSSNKMKDFFDDFFDSMNKAVVTSVATLVVQLARIPSVLNDIVEGLKEAAKPLQGFIGEQILAFANLLAGKESLSITVSMLGLETALAVFKTTMGLMKELSTVAIRIFVGDFKPITQLIEYLKEIPLIKSIAIKFSLPSFSDIKSTLSAFFRDTAEMFTTFAGQVTGLSFKIWSVILTWIKTHWKELIVTALLAIVAIVVAAFGGVIVAAIGTALAAIGTAISTAIASISTFFTGAGLASATGAASVWVTAMLATLAGLVVGTFPILNKYKEDLANFFGVELSVIEGVYAGHWDSMVTVATQMSSDMLVAVQLAFEGISQFIEDNMSGTNTIVADTWNNIMVATTEFVNMFDAETLRWIANLILSVTGLKGTVIGIIADMWLGISETGQANEEQALASVDSFTEKATTKFNGLKTGVLGIFGSLWEGISNILESIKENLTDFKTDVGKVNIPMPELTSAGRLIFDTSDLLGAQTGGIVTREQLIRVGEGSKQEAIIPLERSDVIDKFATSIASKIPVQSTTPQPTNVYNVGTLIGDERSIAELERKLNAVRYKEASRISGGGTYAY